MLRGLGGVTKVGASRRCSPASMIGELLKTKLQVGHLLSVCTTCATQIEQQIAWPHSKRISRGSSSQMMHTREVSGGGVADGTIAACEGTREGGGACGEGGGGCGEARGACGEAGGGCGESGGASGENVRDACGEAGAAAASGAAAATTAAASRAANAVVGGATAAAGAAAAAGAGAAAGAAAAATAGHTTARELARVRKAAVEAAPRDWGSCK